jgi:hypothetical protein
VLEHLRKVLREARAVRRKFGPLRRVSSGNYRMDTVVNHLEDTVVALLGGRRTEALAALRAIDVRALIEMRIAKHSAVWKPGSLARAYKPPYPGTPRQYIRRADARAMFARDGYTCRYCCRPTVTLGVLGLLSKVFP